MAAEMFKHIWIARRQSATYALAAGKTKIDEIEQQISKTIGQMMTLTKDTVNNRLEQRITALEEQKTLLAEKKPKSPNQKELFEERPEIELCFLSRPWKL